MFLILDKYPYLWRIKGGLDIDINRHYYPLTAADDYTIRWFERRFWGCSARPVRKFGERCQSFSVNNRFFYNYLCSINDSKFLYFGTYKLIFLNFPFQSLDASVFQCYAPIPSYNSNDPYRWNCKTEWVHSTTLLRPLFTNFLTTSSTTFQFLDGCVLSKSYWWIS